MTSDTRLAPALPRLVARTVPVADRELLTDRFGIEGTAWIDGDRGFVSAGVAAIVDPRDAVSALRSIDHDRGDAPESIGPRAVGALPFEGRGRMVIPASVEARDESGRVWRTTLES